MEGKTAIVTGAANGIGAATAQRFAKAGVRLILADIDEAGLEKTSKTLSSPHKTVKCDVTVVEDMKRAVETAINEFGGLDIAILNAGVENTVLNAEELSVEEFERVMRINVTGPFIGVKCCVPAIRERGGGAILMTSSTSGKIGAAGLTAYTASKHGVIGLMRAAALEYAGDNIRVNTINPCPVETRMMRALEEGFSPGDAESMRQALTEAIPLKRYAQPDDIAKLFEFLASDNAAFITGGVYMIDGGMTAGLVSA